MRKGDGVSVPVFAVGVWRCLDVEWVWLTFFHSENLLSMLPIIQPVQPVHQAEKENQPSFPKFLFWMLLALFVLFAAKSFIEFDKNGIPRLAKWREKKLEKELEDLDGAEQYVLTAGKNDWYPCFSCPDTTHIYLYLGEVWKYGATTKGQQGRYGKSLKGQYLDYTVQFDGTLEACLKEEKRKIYGYAVLPENLKRPRPLIRPPGNKKDS